jgi:hypothetical protein
MTPWQIFLQVFFLNVLSTIQTVKCVAAFKLRIVNPKIATVADSENRKKKRSRPPKNAKDKVEEHVVTAKENSDIESEVDIQNRPPQKKRKSSKVSYSIVLLYYCQYFFYDIG